MEVEDDEVGGEEFENLSPQELIAMLKKHNITPKGTVGSPPNSERSEGRTGVEEIESSDSSSSSGGSSSSGSTVSTGASKKDTSPSSDEGNTAAPDSGRGGG